MLPLEYKPSAKYMEIYQHSLKNYSALTAYAVMRVAEKIMALRGKAVVLVSLARAGTPIGILVKRYLNYKYQIDVPHYAISIIRGRGIDHNAMRYILARHKAEHLQFIDGWTGKGAILHELKQAVAAYPHVSPTLAVLADPAHVTELCGTHEDFLIPSACLNATVSGLISRTFLREDIISEQDFHGAVFYENLKDADLSYAFIREIEMKMFAALDAPPEICKRFAETTGLDEVKKIAQKFHIADINLIKPGIGETTRVLLRRTPWKILVDHRQNTTYLAHILQLAQEKGVEVVEYPLLCYRTCGIIKKVAADV